LKQGRGLWARSMSLTWLARCGFRPAMPDLDEQPSPPGGCALNISVERLDAVVSVNPPSLELRSRWHSRNWGRLQRTPTLRIVDVSHTFLRAANRFRFAVLSRKLGAGS